MLERAKTNKPPLPPQPKRLTEQEIQRLLEARARAAASEEQQAGQQVAEAAPPNPGIRFYRISSPNWPTATITSPGSGITVTGSLTVTADGTDDVGTVGAILLVDGMKVGSDPKEAPYAFTVDTMTLPNGSHQFVVQTFDIDNHAASSQPIQIQTDNLIFLASVSAPAFTPDGDGLDETIDFSAQFKESVSWILRIRNRSGGLVRAVLGQGTEANVMWDGTDTLGAGVPMGTYEFSFTASAAGLSGLPLLPPPETQWRQLWVGRGPPNWNEINFHAFHGVESGTLSQVLVTYYYTYIGLAPLLWEPHPNIYLAEIRNWNNLLGYTGDIVPDFTDEEFYSNLRTDNLVYVMAHGAYDPNTQITVFGDFEDTEIGDTLVIRDAWEPHNPLGFTFVQMNFCQSADAIDANGNNDLASGFGIFSNPLTVGRAYLGWRGGIRPTNSGMFAFDQTLWDNLTSGINLQDAVADAWAQTIWAGAEPVIVGDPNLVLPNLF